MSDTTIVQRAQVLLHRLARANAVIVTCTQELFVLLNDQDRQGAPLSLLFNLTGSTFATDDQLSRLIIDSAAMTVTWGGRTCALGNTVVFQLIERLARRPNQYVSFDRLIRDVWNGNVRTDETIRSSMRRLKMRLVSAGMDELAAAIKADRRHYGLVLGG